MPLKLIKALGLVRMQEQVHLVHGQFHIESAPGAGTRIVASVPIPATQESSADAGNGAAQAAMGAA